MFKHFILPLYLMAQDKRHIYRACHPDMHPFNSVLFFYLLQKIKNLSRKKIYPFTHFLLFPASGSIGQQQLSLILSWCSIHPTVWDRDKRSVMWLDENQSWSLNRRKADHAVSASWLVIIHSTFVIDPSVFSCFPKSGHSGNTYSTEPQTSPS